MRILKTSLLCRSALANPLTKQHRRMNHHHHQNRKRKLQVFPRISPEILLGLDELNPGTFSKTLALPPGLSLTRHGVQVRLRDQLRGLNAKRFEAPEFNPSSTSRLADYFDDPAAFSPNLCFKWYKHTLHTHTQTHTHLITT